MSLDNIAYPTGAEVKALRAEAARNLGQKVSAVRAAEILGVSADTWRAWEYEKRAMHPDKVKEFRKAVSISMVEGAQARAQKSEPKPDSDPRGIADPQRIKFYRECADLSRDEAGALIGMTGRAWKAWEDGSRPMRTSRLLAWKKRASLLPTPEERAANPALVALAIKQGPVGLRPMPDLPPKSEVPHDPEWEAQMAQDLAKPYLYDPVEADRELQVQARERDKLKLEAVAAFERRMEAESRAIND